MLSDQQTKNNLRLCYFVLNKRRQ